MTNFLQSKQFIIKNRKWMMFMTSTKKQKKSLTKPIGMINTHMNLYTTAFFFYCPTLNETIPAEHIIRKKRKKKFLFPNVTQTSSMAKRNNKLSDLLCVIWRRNVNKTIFLSFFFISFIFSLMRRMKKNFHFACFSSHTLDFRLYISHI